AVSLPAMVITGAAVPRFAPHIRFRFDETRQRWTVLAPERLLLPDEQAVEILQLVDGARSVDQIVDELCRRYEAPRGEVEGDRPAVLAGAQAMKREAARLVREAGLPLTVNAVVHRQNLARLPAMIERALAWGAGRLEVAHVQYYGWALVNRDALLPNRAEL